MRIEKLERREGRSPATVVRLTSREVDALRRLAQGLRNKEIAADLGIEENTVQQMVSMILRNLGLSNRSTLVALLHMYPELLVTGTAILIPHPAGCPCSACQVSRTLLLPSLRELRGCSFPPLLCEVRL